MMENYEEFVSTLNVEDIYSTISEDLLQSEDYRNYGLTEKQLEEAKVLGIESIREGFSDLKDRMDDKTEIAVFLLAGVSSTLDWQKAGIMAIMLTQDQKRSERVLRRMGEKLVKREEFKDVTVDGIIKRAFSMRK